MSEVTSIHDFNYATFKHCTPDGDKLIAEIARVKTWERKQR